jgi:hypothetical protein
LKVESPTLGSPKKKKKHKKRAAGIYFSWRLANWYLNVYEK